MIDRDLLNFLRCPVTHQPLREALPEELHALGPDLTAGLIREDGQMLYPVRNGIPQLVPGEAIPLTRGPSPQ
ncbi:MAG: Trm112 family protein [Verrucomicrobia bacterium]|nr:Trm112 family protein [Verrucomicrobiota bacterium]